MAAFSVAGSDVLSIAFLRTVQAADAMARLTAKLCCVAKQIFTASQADYA
jgi:hypothetical protein